MQQKTYHPYSGSSLRLLVSALVALLSVAVGFAQNTGGSRTIDITSSFKPSLIPPKKIIPNATPAMVNGTRTVQPYDVPVQQLSFKYAPSPLKPLAFKDSAIADASKGYVKAGYGNFATPWLKAAINFGSGETVNGNLEGYYTSSQGKLPYQEFAKYGAKAHSIFQLNENHALDARVGYKGQNLYRYGFQPDTLKFSKEELKLNYNEAQLGATLGNRQGGEFGLYYKATLDGYFFSDNLNGNETALHYDLPLEKELGENVSFDIGIKGVVSNVKVPDTSFSNNVTILKAGVRMKIGEHSSIRAGLLPSWNNGEFKLLPQAEIEAFLPDKDLTFEAGVVGGYIENTWRSLTNFNPWIEQPDQLTHSRNLDIYAGLKANINENWFYKIKGGFQQRHNVPLYANDQEDGKTFNILWEPSLNIIRASGELVWSQGDKYSWSNQVVVQGFSGFEVHDKAYGLLPLEITSSFRGKVMDKLIAKVDMYHFAPPWKLSKGKTERGDGGFDLNFGAEFDLMKKVKLWVQFNNLLNNDYQRWNQYPVLGFQALGGVIVHF